MAAYKAQRGKRSRLCVQHFNFKLESELLRLQHELIEGNYIPGGFRTHWIQKPKPRLISAAPYRDRVVHHALMNVLEPILDRHFHPHSFACRKGKGTHAATDRVQKLMRKNKYILQCDVKKFFPSIDHEILKHKYHKLIKDVDVLRLMDMIVNHSNQQENPHQWFVGDDLFSPLDRAKGLPIGNLTSQWLANWYLNDLDHFVTKKTGIGSYVRYCDDFVLLSDNRQRLVEARDVIKLELQNDRMKLHENKLFIKPTKAGVTFVGYRTWPDFRLLRKDNIRNFRRRVKWMQSAYSSGLIDFGGVKSRLDSWMAHASHANSRKLILRLSKDWKFQRAMTDELSRYPRRQLEQQCQQLPGCQSQQQQPEQPQQQRRISCVPALFKNQVPNRMVYGPCESDKKSPGCCPELMGLRLHSRISTRLGVIGRLNLEDSTQPLKTKSRLAA